MDKTTNNSEHIPSPVVPPSPAEVAVRTMASDIASIAESGGGSPRPHPIKVFLQAERNKGAPRSASIFSSSAASKQEAPPRKPLFSNPAYLFSSLAVFVVVVFLAGYFIYPLFNKKPVQENQAVVSIPNQTPETFESKQFFSQSTDGIITLDILLAIDGLQVLREQLVSKIGDLSGSFFEIKIENGNSQPISAANFFSLIKSDIFETDFLNNNFEKDFRVFLYKDKNIFWPGYILQIKTGESRIFLQALAQPKIENASSSLNNLFLEPSGTPGTQFRDEMLSGQPIRILNFSNSSSVIAYGWFHEKYLVISASLGGLKQAVLRF